MRQSNLGCKARGKEGSGHKPMLFGISRLKGLSPETDIIEEVDLVHIWGKQYSWDAMLKVLVFQELFRGLRPWHDTEWLYWELGRPGCFLDENRDDLKQVLTNTRER